MRGTGYLVLEIVLWLVASALIGVVVGWLIRGWRREKKIRKRIEASVTADRPDAGELATKLAEAEARSSDLAAENERLLARVAELEAGLDDEEEGSGVGEGEPGEDRDEAEDESAASVEAVGDESAPDAAETAAADTDEDESSAS